MAGVIWRETLSNHAYNAIVVAGAKETIADSVGNRRQYGPFNRLMVKNRDAVDIQIQIDGLTQGGYIFEIAAGETLLIEPEDGIKFDFIVKKNLDAVVAEVADNILIRWAKCVRAG